MTVIFGKIKIAGMKTHGIIHKTDISLYYCILFCVCFFFVTNAMDYEQQDVNDTFIINGYECNVIITDYTNISALDVAKLVWKGKKENINYVNRCIAKLIATKCGSFRRHGIKLISEFRGYLSIPVKDAEFWMKEWILPKDDDTIRMFNAFPFDELSRLVKECNKRRLRLLMQYNRQRFENDDEELRSRYRIVIGEEFKEETSLEEEK